MSLFGRVVEVSNGDRSVSAWRGFLIIRDSASGEKIGQIPIGDVGALIVQGHGVMVSNSALARLAEGNSPVITVDERFQPAGVMMPIVGHHGQAGRFDAQASASLPTKKRLWQQIVRAKIRQQAAVLEAVGETDIQLAALVDRVRSGDPDNIEAQAARRYWPRLFGRNFSRRQTDLLTNHMLNYGYAALRAATARAVVAAGLHPTLGLHHRNAGNPMRLVDDLMEPFRPFIDFRVRLLHDTECEEMNSEVKQLLVSTLYTDLDTGDGRSPLATCLHEMANSLARVFMEETKELRLPLVQHPRDAVESSTACQTS